MDGRMSSDNVRLREEVFAQIKSLEAMKEMAAGYGHGHIGAGGECQGSRTMALFWLSGGSKGAKWGSYEPGANFYLLGHLY